MATLQLRFRHTALDLGPFPFPEGNSIQQVKDKLLTMWPTDGPLAKEVPSSSAEIKLIFNGKFLDGAKALKDYKKEMGELLPDSIVTMHLLVRPSVGSKTSGAAASEDAPKGCACAIS